MIDQIVAVKPTVDNNNAILATMSSVYREDDMLVFVYGSLMKGLQLAELLHSSKFVGKRIINGQLWKLKGAWYPAFISGTGIVHGELYLVTKDTMRTLDRAEGVPNLYQRICTQTTEGEDCFVYEYVPRTYFDKQVQSGDWWDVVRADKERDIA